jgi:hypothetical protein
MYQVWALAALVSTSLLVVQTDEKFKIRFTPVPMDLGMRSTVAGSGTGAAILAGSKLTINAAFDGMPSPATAGVRGSAFLELTVTKSSKGTVSGTFDLSPDQIAGLKEGKLYIVISSEKAPEGTLWGWILK